MSPESKTRGLVDVAFVASCRAPRASRLRCERGAPTTTRQGNADVHAPRAHTRLRSRRSAWRPPTPRSVFVFLSLAGPRRPDPRPSGSHRRVPESSSRGVARWHPRPIPRRTRRRVACGASCPRTTAAPLPRRQTVPPRPPSTLPTSTATRTSSVWSARPPWMRFRRVAPRWRARSDPWTATCRCSCTRTTASSSSPRTRSDA